VEPDGAAGPVPTAEVRLREFWAEAGVPADRWPYLEFQARRYASIVRFLRAVGTGPAGRTLDLGGGAGSLCVVLASELGGRYELAEYLAPSAAHAEALRRRGVGATYAVDLSKPGALARLPSEYDRILLVEVIEHLLVNPLLLFREVWEHLRPGGQLFLTTPNPARLSNRGRLLLGRTIKERGRYPRDASGVFGHVIEYGRAELDLLARSESLEPERATVIQQAPSPRPSARQRLGVRLLNSAPARRLELGDDILASYRKVPRPADGRCPVPIDPSGRI
jgi:2-polyprenyl-3-methyl-5-hydroxy-6-metoxy-1,4-benzoquinol methylase